MLVSDAPHSDWAWILKEGELWWEAWSHLLESVQSGRPGFDLVHGKGLFDYLADAGTTDVARRTLAALSSAGTDRQVQAILEAYDFGAVATVVDVGGGDGSLLFGALRRHPHLSGVLFDLPYVVALARSSAEPADITDRCEFVGGSFFESVPAERGSVRSEVDPSRLGRRPCAQGIGELSACDSSGRPHPSDRGSDH